MPAADLEAEFERDLPESSLLAFRVAFSVLRQREDPRDPELEAASIEFRQRLWKAIDELPEKLRLVVLLAAIQGHDPAEVAGLADLAVQLASGRIRPESVRMPAAESAEIREIAIAPIEVRPLEPTPPLEDPTERSPS
jgi:hypothetical protein